MTGIPAEPAAAGAPPRPSTARIWLLAIRPATLPAALSGVVVGLGAALAVGTPFRADTALGCLAVALLLQITANLANDLSDFRKGADTPARTGPIRVAAAGLVSERRLELAIALTIALAGIVGLWLTTVGGPILLVIGLLAVVAALAYTGGPWPYGYRGLGEVFVFLFFGLVAVVGTAYLQAGRARAGLPRGGDPGRRPDDGHPRRQQPARHPDRHAGRQADAGGHPRSGGARWGSTGSCSASPTSIPVVLAVAGYGIAVLLPLATLALVRPLLATVSGFSEPRQLNPVLKATARLAFLHSLLFGIGLAIGGAVG